jgi:hypothetical protein
MTPEQKLAKLKSILDLLKEDQVTPEQLRTVADEFLKVAKHIQTTLESKVEESNGQNTAQMQGIRASIAQVEKLVSEVRADLFLDLTEARDRFTRELKTVQALIPTLPDLTYLEEMIQDVRDAIPAPPDLSLIEGAIAEARVDLDAIPGELKKLEEKIESIKIEPATAGGMPTLRLHVNGEYVGNTRDLVFTGSGITSTIANGRLTLVVSGGGSGGFTVETPTGAVNASNTSYTVTAEPQYMIADGISYFDGKGYTYAALTITFDVPPSQYVRAII